MGNRRNIVIAIAALILTLSVLGAGNPAFATDSSSRSTTAVAPPTHPTQPAHPRPGVPDRVIDKSSQRLNLPLAGAADAASANSGHFVTIERGAPSMPADEQPRVGETVKVVYADATVMNTSIAAGCTLSTTAGNPYLVTSPVRAVRATVKYYQSGCSGITKAGGWLYMYWGFDWTEIDNNYLTPVNGSTYTFGLIWNCTNTNSSPFHSTAENAVSGQVGTTIVNVSSNINLACGS